MDFVATSHILALDETILPVLPNPGVKRRYLRTKAKSMKTQGKHRLIIQNYIYKKDVQLQCVLHICCRFYAPFNWSSQTLNYTTRERTSHLQFRKTWCNAQC